LPSAPEPDALPAIPGTELSAALELALRARCGGPLRLTVTDNRRTMLSLHKRKELIEVRLHHMFLRAPAPVWDALSDYLFSGDRAGASEIARYIEQHRKHIRHTQERPLALSTAGVHHDLHEICRDINQRYFQGRADVHITWGRSHVQTHRKTRAARRSIKLGSYTSRERLIRVHPALDAAFVPRFFVEYIVYHEMLHHVLPPTLSNGRRDLHGPEFQRRERKFEQYQAALAWERENLDRLLRKRAQPRRSRL
jgi:predicted metal-dependent hydrolase